MENKVLTTDKRIDFVVEQGKWTNKGKGIFIKLTIRIMNYKHYNIDRSLKEQLYIQKGNATAYSKKANDYDKY